MTFFELLINDFLVGILVVSGLIACFRQYFSQN